jgi:hypothetical protein
VTVAADPPCIKQYALMPTDDDPCSDQAGRREKCGAEARSFAAGHLTKVATSPDASESVYACPLSGQLWLEDSRSGMASGDAPRLRIIHEPPAWCGPERPTYSR